MYQALLAPLTLVVGPAYVKNATSETPTLRILATYVLIYNRLYYEQRLIFRT